MKTAQGLLSFSGSLFEGRKEVLKKLRKAKKTREVVAFLPETHHVLQSKNLSIWLTRLNPKAKIEDCDDCIWLSDIFIIETRKDRTSMYPLIKHSTGTYIYPSFPVPYYIGLANVKRALRKQGLEFFIPLLEYVKNF